MAGIICVFSKGRDPMKAEFTGHSLQLEPMVST
jgi:hypothetical protein